MRLEIPTVFTQIDLSIDSPALRSKPFRPLQNARLSAGGDNLLSTHGVRKANFRWYLSGKRRAHVREFRTTRAHSFPFKEISRRVFTTSRMRVRYPIISRVVKRPVVRRGSLYREVFDGSPLAQWSFRRREFRRFPPTPSNISQLWQTITRIDAMRCS